MKRLNFALKLVGHLANVCLLTSATYYLFFQKDYQLASALLLFIVATRDTTR